MLFFPSCLPFSFNYHGTFGWWGDPQNGTHRNTKTKSEDIQYLKLGGLVLELQFKENSQLNVNSHFSPL